MLRPILIVAEQNSKWQEGPSYFGDHFIDFGFYPMMIPYDYGTIGAKKDLADYFLLVLPEVLTDVHRQTCFYLRDMCIDEEKQIFLCGSKANLAAAGKILPKMILAGSYEIAVGEYAYVAKRIKEKLSTENELPGCLIIDDDAEYARRMRLALSKSCNVAISDGKTGSLTPYIMAADLLILSLDLKMDFLAWERLRLLIYKRKKQGKLGIVLLSKSFARQIEVTRELNLSSVCLSKETDFLKNANYIMRRFFPGR